MSGRTNLSRSHRQKSVADLEKPENLSTKKLLLWFSQSLICFYQEIQRINRTPVTTRMSDIKLRDQVHSENPTMCVRGVDYPYKKTLKLVP